MNTDPEKLRSKIDLRSLIEQVARTYSRTLPPEQLAQKLIENSAEILEPYVPLGFLIRGSGQANFPLPIVPWIGIADPDETIYFTRGIYLVYLFSADMKFVYLSLNQGSDRIAGKELLKTSERLDVLRERARQVRERNSDLRVNDLNIEIDLRHDGGRPSAYESGNIYAIKYEASGLPSATKLESDLARFIDEYRQVLRVRDGLSYEGRLTHELDKVDFQKREEASTGGFNPKSDADYIVEIKQRTILKSRRHETLVRTFGEHCRNHGFEVTTPHPADLLIKKGGVDWLVEVKIIYGMDFVSAARSALAQLLDYQHFIYPQAKKIALFDQNVAGAYIGLLRSNQIDVVISEKSNWYVSSTDKALLALGTINALS